MTTQKMDTVVTGKVRLSYVHLFTPHARQAGADPKYSTTILLPKSDVATKQRIDAAINAAIQEGTTSKWNGVRPPMLAIPIHDGDGVRPSDGMPFGEECRGHWVFTASSKQAPQVVDISINPVLNQTEIYSGIYARVTIRFFPFSTNGKKGIGCGLGPVQKLEDGEPLGGGISAAVAFGGAPAYPQQPQQPMYQPQQPTYQQPQQPMYQQPMYQQPAYQPQQPVYQPAQQPTYPQQPPVTQIDPITGMPATGGIYGI